MKFKTLILNFIVLISWQINFVHAAEFKEDFIEKQIETQKLDESKFVNPNTNFEERYEVEAIGCQLFLNISLNSYFDAQKNANNLLSFQNFLEVMDDIQNKINDAKISYLADTVKNSKNIDQLQDDEKFDYIKIYPPANFHNFNWNQQFPVLADGYKSVLEKNLQNVVSYSLACINLNQLSAQAISQQLHEIIAKIETDLIIDIQVNRNNIQYAIDDSIRNNNAIYFANMPTLSYLLQNKNLNVIKNKFSKDLQLIQYKFCYAIRHHKINAVQSFIQAHIDVNGIENDDWTPLIIADSLNHLEMVKLLIDAGADINRTNKYGKTAFDYALDNSKKTYLSIEYCAQAKNIANLLVAKQKNFCVKQKNFCVIS